MEKQLLVEDQFSAFLLDQDVVIVNSDGDCVASSNPNRIGMKMAEQDEKNQINGDFELLIKHLTSLTIQQSLELNKLSQSSLDLLLAKIVKQNRLLPEEINHFKIESKALGFDFSPRRVAVIVFFPEFENKFLLNRPKDYNHQDVIEEFKSKIRNAICGFFTKDPELITTYVGDGKFVAFKRLETPGDEQNFFKNMSGAYKSIFLPLDEIKDGNYVVSFGNPYAGISGLIEAYKEANLALEAGIKISKKDSQAYYFGNLQELRILAMDDNQKKAKYANDLISRLDEDSRNTLETFFRENLNITNTATKLKIHPNTVTYRLKKINKILGLDPRIFEDAARIEIALLASKLFSA